MKQYDHRGEDWLFTSAFVAKVAPDSAAAFATAMDTDPIPPSTYLQQSKTMTIIAPHTIQPSSATSDQKKVG